jgi:GTP cyclohydrolase I
VELSVVPNVDQARLRDICRQLLAAIGEDPDRPGLQDTPRRWAAAWAEFIDFDPGRTETTFELVEVDQMVIVKWHPIWSRCEHHLEPFSADVSVGYIAKNRVLGVSKIPRIIDFYAHRLQLQEQLCRDVADHIGRIADTESVAVLAEGQHLCMTARGVQSSATMISEVVRGVFREKPEARAEFLSLVSRR